MPAEWEPHEATWLSWPHREGISFPNAYERVLPVLARAVDALADSETVCINVMDADEEAFVRFVLDREKARSGHVIFHHLPTNEPWCRDHGPIFVTRMAEPQMAVINWGYNAWGEKYPPFDLDDAVPLAVAAMKDLPVYSPGIVLEGGSIEVNGCGTLLTTQSCLLNPNRNPELSKERIEQKLRDYLGVNNILWLGEGIEGDDTDGHIDDITRFVAPTTVVTALEENENDPNHRPLQKNAEKLSRMKTENGTALEVVSLPMPAKIVREGQRLPASYANFYIANSAVLLPVFETIHDRSAVAVLQKVFPERRIVPIDCRELIWGLGAFHCLTQQQPRLS
jgi:agmatine deiminase